MRKPLITVGLAMVALFTLAACESTTPKNEAQKSAFSDEAQAALTRMKEQDSSLNDVLSRCYGFVIFPSIGKGGFIVGGASGRGEVYENGQLIGYATMTQGSIGLQAGGQEYAELIAFQTREALEKFKGGNFTLGAAASAVVVKAGAAGTAQFKEGIAIFTMPKGGLMFEAQVGGQKINFEPLGQAGSTTQPSK